MPLLFFVGVRSLPFPVVPWIYILLEYSLTISIASYNSSFSLCLHFLFFAVVRRTEFIRIISDQSNEICEQDKKKTIAPEHIIDALKVSLGHPYPQRPPNPTPQPPPPPTPDLLSPRKEMKTTKERKELIISGVIFVFGL